MSIWTPEAFLGASDSKIMITRLSHYLRRSGFLEAQVAALLGAADTADFASNSVLYALDSLESTEILCASTTGLLVQLFICNGEAPIKGYMRMLPGDLRRLLERLDLLEFNLETVSARASITPCLSMYFLSDPLFNCFSRAEEQQELIMSELAGFVMPPHASTFLLLDNIEDTRGRLIDVGCGSGVLSLGLRDRQDKVTGIDSNPRAIAYSRLNSLLNGKDVNFRLGDFREGYDERGYFDQLIFNGPTKSTHKTCTRETGALSAEEIVIGIAQSAATVLRPGGTAQVLVIVEVHESYDSATDIIREWLRKRPEVRSFRVTEVPVSTLGIPSQAIMRGRLQPGCLLADDQEDGNLLMEYLREQGIREVMPAVVSMVM
jgi:SAM-dependent methyltransferase